MNEEQHAGGLGPLALAPTPGSRACLRPLGTGAVRILSGFWCGYQRLNREVSLPHAAAQWERTGMLDNLRVAAGRMAGTHHGILTIEGEYFKWLEALCWEYGRHASPELAHQLDAAVALIAAAQAPDGYLNTYYQITNPAERFSDEAVDFVLYCGGHLIQAGVAHARTTGSPTLLAVACRFADFVDGALGEEQRVGIPGHPGIETALVELFRLTCEERYLRLARTFIDRRGHGLLARAVWGPSHYQDYLPYRDAVTMTGHAVAALYLACGATDVYLETGDDRLLQAAVRQWESVVTTKMYLTGGVGSRHRDEAFGDPYELPPDRAYCETCAAVASIMWNWRLFLATGDARYTDLIERTLYNGFLAGLALDGKGFFYVNPLQLRSGHKAPAAAASARRASWFACPCCPPNIMRLLATLDQYVATVTTESVQIHQYCSAAIETAGRGLAVGLRMETDYPWDGAVSLVVTATPDAPWTLGLRIPVWCRQAALAINDTPAALDCRPGAYARVTRAWRPGDHVLLTLPLVPRVTVPHERIDAVRGCLAFERGPLVYCFEQVDLPPGIDLADVVADGDGTPVVRRRPDLLSGVDVLEVAGAVCPADAGHAWPYQRWGEYERARYATAATLMAVPYFAWANRGGEAMRVWLPAAERPAQHARRT